MNNIKVVRCKYCGCETGGSYCCRECYSNFEEDYSDYGDDDYEEDYDEEEDD